MCIPAPIALAKGPNSRTKGKFQGAKMSATPSGSFLTLQSKILAITPGTGFFLVQSLRLFRISMMLTLTPAMSPVTVSVAGRPKSAQRAPIMASSLSLTRHNNCLSCCFRQEMSLVRPLLKVARRRSWASSISSFVL